MIWITDCSQNITFLKYKKKTEVAISNNPYLKTLEFAIVQTHTYKVKYMYKIKNRIASRSKHENIELGLFSRNSFL